MNIRSKILMMLATLGLASSLLVAAPALAQTTASGSGSAPTGSWSGRGHMTGQMPGVFGTVSAISGTTLTVNSKGFGKTATPTTYTVDASNATVMKSGATSAVSDIAVGDTVMVAGTISGTTVTATSIRDGIPQGMGMGPGGMASSTRMHSPMTQIQGNGEPVVGGTVAAVSGTTLTVNAKAGTSYSVDASSAFVEKGNATSSVSAIATGDQVVVQGTVQGTSVVASSVIDQGAAPSGSGSGSPMSHGLGGVMGAIGGFFQHLFGFF